MQLSPPVSLLALLVAAAPAQEPAEFVGHWEGEIAGAGVELDVDVAWSDGTFTGDASIPAQGIRDRALDPIALEDGVLTFVISGIPGDPTFEGTLSDDGTTLSGPFRQGGAELAFELVRAEPAAARAGERLEGLADWLQETRAAWEVPGVAVAVVVDDEVVLARGFGRRDVENDLPVTTDTLFAIGSASKAFTTFLLAQLAEDDRLDWDRPVHELLPGFRMQDDYATLHVTVRDLVTHRTGLPRHDLAWYNRADFGGAEIVAALAAFEPSEELRAAWQYNNLAYATAGHLAATLGGASWEDLVRQRILEPAGMDRANFSVRESEADADHAVPYVERDDEVVAVPFRDVTNIGPAGSINASLDSMTRWVRLHLGGGSIEGTELLSAPATRTLHTPQMVLPSLPDEPELAVSSYAHGWFVDGYRGHLRVHHGGNIDGFSALVSFFPHDDTGVVVLTNKGATPLPELVVRRVADQLFELEPIDWSGRAKERADGAEEMLESVDEEAARVEGTSPAHALAAYAGTYEHDGYGRLTVEQEGEALRMTYNGIAAPLEHWHYETFRAGRDADDPALEKQLVHFVTGVDGHVEAVTLALEPTLARIRFERGVDAELLDPAYLAAFEGEYELMGEPIVLRVDDEGLEATTDDGTNVLEPLRRDEFRVQDEEADVRIVAVRDDAGAVVALEVRVSGQALRAERKE